MNEPTTAVGKALRERIQYLDYDAYDAARWLWDDNPSIGDGSWPGVLSLIEQEAVATERARLRAWLTNPDEYLSACGCGSANPNFGEGTPGGHFTDCLWAHEVDVRGAILDVLGEE